MSSNAGPGTLDSLATILAKKELTERIAKRNVVVRTAVNARTSMEFVIACLDGLEICVKIPARTRRGESTVNISANASTTLDAENPTGSVYASQASWGKSAKKFALKVIMERIVSKSATATSDRIRFATQLSAVSVDPVTEDRTATFPRLANFHLMKTVC